MFAVAIGAVVGAVLGGASGFGVSRLQSRRKESATPAGLAAKRLVLDVPVRYLVEGGEFFMPLQRLHSFISATDPNDKELFQYIVTAVDTILGLELHIANRALPHRASLPVAAQRTRNNMKAALADLVQINIERMPSAIRKDEMEAAANEIGAGLDEVIVGMHRTMSA